MTDKRKPGRPVSVPGRVKRSISLDAETDAILHRHPRPAELVRELLREWGAKQDG
jgi:hypothetical protein